MPRTDRASKVVPAPPNEVYAALMDPDALVSWLPPGEMLGRMEHFDPRPGGSYRMTLTHPEAGRGRGKTTDLEDVVDVRFVEVVPARRVVQEVDFVSDDPAVGGTMTMTWAFDSVSEGTRVRLTAHNVPDGVGVEDHMTGMQASLRQLATYLSQTSGSV